MTLTSVVSERHATWVDTLYRYGYVIEKHPRTQTSAHLGTVGVRGRRRADLGAPEVVIDVAERWEEGADPGGFRLERHGCHLEGSSWHAQIEPGEEGAERIDVDRNKPGGLTIHRHPFGSHNDVRRPLQVVPALEAWVREIETISANIYFK